MSYAHQKNHNGLTLTQVVPLDSRIVHIYATVRLPVRTHSYTPVDLELYALLVLCGTKKKNKDAIDLYLKRYGITLSVTSGIDSLTFTCSVRNTNVRHAITLLKELIHEPVLEQKEFDKKRRTLLEENREAHDDARRITDILFREILYPHGAPERYQSLKAEKKDIERASRKTLLSIQKSLRTGAWYVTFVGNEAVYADMKPLVTRLGAQSEAVQEESSIPEMSSTKSSYQTVHGKTNVEVRIGNIVPITPSHPDYEPLAFGIAVLGKVGGFSGRLMDVVREKEGLTYGIYATLTSRNMLTRGHWFVYTFFTGADLKQGITSTIREIRNIVKGGITDRELNTFKTILRNAFVIARGSNAGRTAAYHAAALFGQTPEDVDKTLNRIDSMTKTAVNSALKQYIDPDVLVISGAGPVTKNGEGILNT